MWRFQLLNATGRFYHAVRQLKDVEDWEIAAMAIISSQDKIGVLFQATTFRTFRLARACCCTMTCVQVSQDLCHFMTGMASRPKVWMQLNAYHFWWLLLYANIIQYLNHDFWTWTWHQDMLTDASEMGVRRSAARIADAIFDKEASNTCRSCSFAALQMYAVWG